MFNIKKISLCSLLMLTLSNATIASDSGWDSFWRVLFRISVEENQPKENRSRLEQEISDYIDRLLATSSQPHHIKQKIQEKKSAFIRRTVPKIENMDHLTDIEKVLNAQQEAHAWLLQSGTDQIDESARKYIKRMHTNPPINRELLRRVSDFQVLKETNDEMLRKLQKAAEDSRYGALKDFVGDQLDKQIQFKVEQKFGIHDRQAPSNYRESTPSYYPSYPQPSAPPASETTRPTPPASSNEIFEIYPDFKSDERNKDWHRKREQGKLYRENDCSVCLESFHDLGKRVTLFCGHSICPSCLFSWLYESYRNSCPICRDKIEQDEFSKNYLRPYR